jgi:hypothetical protein
LNARFSTHTFFISHRLVALALVLLAVTLRGLVTRYFAEQLRDRLITQAAMCGAQWRPLMHEDGFEPWLTREGRGDLQRDLKEYASRNGIRCAWSASIRRCCSIRRRRRRRW